MGQSLAAALFDIVHANNLFRISRLLILTMFSSNNIVGVVDFSY